MLHAVEKKAIGISNYARAREEREAANAAAGTPRRGERMFSSKVASRIRQPTPSYAEFPPPQTLDLCKPRHPSRVHAPAPPSRSDKVGERLNCQIAPLQLHVVMILFATNVTQRPSPPQNYLRRLSPELAQMADADATVKSR